MDRSSTNLFADATTVDENVAILQQGLRLLGLNGLLRLKSLEPRLGCQQFGLDQQPGVISIPKLG